MRSLLSLAIGLTPVLVFLVGLIALDSYKLLRLSSVLWMVAAGGAAAGGSLLVHESLLARGMDTVTLAELQQHPDPLLDRVRAGERLLIVRDGHPVAELRPVESSPSRSRRPRGLCAGQFVVPDDFDAPLPEDILQDFEGR